MSDRTEPAKSLPFGEWLKNWRMGRGQSLAQLGAVIGCKSPFLSRVERGEAMASPNLIALVAAEAGVDEALLFALARRLPPWAEELLAGDLGGARLALLRATREMSRKQLEALVEHLERKIAS